MPEFFIFHGWGADSGSNWFPWLKTELEKNAFSVTCPDMPNTHTPKQEEWIAKALEFRYDENTILIGHSLGTILILRLLEKSMIKAKAAYLVSAFDNCTGYSELQTFFETPFDYAAIKRNCGNITMLSSDNDPFIPMSVAERLAGNLGCRLIVFKNREHLNMGTGSFQFPELLEIVLEDVK